MVKVAFQSPDGEVETLWAVDLGGGRYRLDNTPWYAYGVSWQDVIEARPAADGQLYYERVSEKSGNQTIRIVADEPFPEEWLAQITKRGCSFEGANRKYIAINIPPDVDLATVASFLTNAGVGNTPTLRPSNIMRRKGHRRNSFRGARPATHRPTAQLRPESSELR